MMKQMNLSVPDGTTQHDDPHLLCLPTKWSDIVTFLLLNYVAHAATVVTYPGESLLSIISAIALALIFPTSGIIRGLTAILRHGSFVRDPLQQAARAGALCMVVRNKEWRPRPGDTVQDIIFRGQMKRRCGRKFHFGPFWYALRDHVSLDGSAKFTRLAMNIYRPPWTFEFTKIRRIDTESYFISTSVKVHGFYHLEPGYSFAYVPSNAVVTSNVEWHSAIGKNCAISNNYSAAKAIVAIIQLLFACFTISRNSTSEIRDNGYGSYTLTIVPFALMSVVNLLGVLINPQYPTLFIVHSDVMDEAANRGCKFDGVVGAIVKEPTEISGIRNNQCSGTFEYEPPLNVIAGAGELDDLILTIDCPSATESLASVSTLLKTLNYSPFRQAIKLGTTQTQIRATTIADRPRIRLVSPSDSWGDEPSIFIPSCSAIKRRDRLSFSAEYNRLVRNRSWGFHFFLRHDTSRILVQNYGLMLLSLLVSALSIAVIGIVTRFHGYASKFQAVVFMLWLGIGIYFGSSIHNLKLFGRRNTGFGLFIGLGLLYWILPVGIGFWTVVQMMKRYGTCIYLRE